MLLPKAEVGVFGGSGFYSFLEGPREVAIETPYGLPSDSVSVGEISGRKVAFMPRHGRHHELPPHAINYRANMWAFRELGITRVLAPCAAGSLQPNIRPGDFVVCDQIFDRTSGRRDTFYDGPETVHVTMADPYCPHLRSVAVEAAGLLGINVHPQGTMVVTQGPRFSTRAESAFYSGQGWHVIGMTQYPEVVLARELQMCFVNISLVTDYDAGVTGHSPVSAEAVLQVFRENTEKLGKLLNDILPRIPVERTCFCADVLRSSRI
jgi:5'-methylthioadenosine phosphorylase